MVVGRALPRARGDSPVRRRSSTPVMERLLCSPCSSRWSTPAHPRSSTEAALAVFLRLGSSARRHAVPIDPTRCRPNGTCEPGTSRRRYRSQRYQVRAAATISRCRHRRLRQLFRQAMRRRSPSAGDDVVVPLSGGRDSGDILFELCASGRAPELHGDDSGRIRRGRPRTSGWLPFARELGGLHVLLAQTRVEPVRPELARRTRTPLCSRRTRLVMWRVGRRARRKPGPGRRPRRGVVGAEPVSEPRALTVGGPTRELAARPAAIAASRSANLPDAGPPSALRRARCPSTARSRPFRRRSSSAHCAAPIRSSRSISGTGSAASWRSCPTG